MQSSAPARWTPSHPRPFWIALVLLLSNSLLLWRATGVANYDALYQHLGGEYFNIGRALADGRGFSDPFGEATGPTAWMPPLYPCWLAGLLLLLQSRSAVTVATLIATVLVLTAVGVALYVSAARVARGVSPLVIVALFSLWMLVFWRWHYLVTSDAWLLTLLVTCAVALIADQVRTRRVRSYYWGGLVGAAILSSPALAFAIIAVGVVFAVRGRSRKQWLMAATIAAGMSAPWLARNAVVFGQLVPSKSNLAFEAYQANVLDADGIYDSETMKLHPYTDERIRFLYSRAGETAFVAKHGQIFLRSLVKEPLGYFRRVSNRLVAATIQYVPMTGGEPSVLARVISPLPWLAIAAAYLSSSNRRLILAILGFAGAYLAPYVFVAFYSRYLVPLTPALVLLSFLALNTFREVVARHLKFRNY